MQSRLNIGLDQGSGPSVSRPEPHELPLDRGQRLDVGDGRRLLFVAEGLIALSTILPDGRRQILSLSTPGETVCPTGAADYWVEALTRSNLRLTPLPDGTHGRDELFRLVHERLVSANAHLLTLGRLNGQERLAIFLADMCRRLGRSQGDGSVALHLLMTRDDVADYLGLNTETVSRLFTRLKNSDLVRFQTPTRLVVPNLAALDAKAPIAVLNGAEQDDGA